VRRIMVYSKLKHLELLILLLPLQDEQNPE
jgi:hypothetical protein